MFNVYGKHTAVACAMAMAPLMVIAAGPAPAPNVLVIGASYGNAAIPFDDQLQAPLGGIAVNFGDYLSLGNALVAEKKINGRVINEAQAGATTFPRLACPPPAAPDPTCGPAGWQGYQTQLDKAVARTAVPDPATGAVLEYKATHVVITIPNDCLHSDSRGIPQAVAQPCTASELNEVATRLIAVGQSALDKGITPVYTVYPAYSSLDLPFTESAFGFAWVIDEQGYNYLRSNTAQRIRHELPGALVVDAWKGFTHMGDGLHPDERSTRKAADRIAKAIVKDLKP